MSEIEVKALEWSCSTEWKPGEFVTEWFVFSVAGHYRLWHDDTVTPAVWHVSYPAGSEQPYEGTEHPNIEAAKAAAQADYEARIRSALVERKAEPVAYASSKEWRKNHLMSAAQYKSALSKNIVDFDIPLYAHPPTAQGTVTEEMRVAACRSLNERGKGNNVTICDVVAMLEAALSASPPVDSRDGLITDAMVRAYKATYLKHCDDALNGRIPRRAEDFTFEASRKGIAAALAAKEQQP